jgi:lysophospholipase L1-like esterase
MKIPLLTSLFFFGMLTAPPPALAQEEPPDGPAPAGKPWEPAWGFWPKSPASWHPTHLGFVKKVQAGGVEILFLGDSVTKGWAGAGKEIWEQNYAPLKALNIGIGGDTTRQTLWRLDHKAMDGIQPRVVVLMIGVNNIFTATGTDEEIVKGIDATVQKIRALSPPSKILLMGILPVGNEAQAARIRNINAMLVKVTGPGVSFLDMGPQFCDAGGKVDSTLYTPDLVHLAAPGYARWNETMRPALEGLLK